jgi:gamma-glutamyltranspeptidase/glutathione hydrolase
MRSPAGPRGPVCNDEKLAYEGRLPVFHPSVGRASGSDYVSVPGALPMRDFAFPGRSPVIARRAMCATSHPAASLAAVEVLKAGGNAMDAAITATALLCVIEPAMTGIGGDCFALIHKPGMKKPIGFNASGKAPAAATADWYARQGIKALETYSPHAVTVPGAVDGWATLLKDHGTISLAKALGPAIEAAEGGYAVAPRIAHDWMRLEGKIRLDAGARQHLLVEDRVPKAGEIVRQPALARTLKTIAEKGRDGFYTGEVAADIVAELAEKGGLHTVADFAAQSAAYVEPIATTYNGVELWELPPNNHGVVALILLNVLARLGKLSDDPHSADRYHALMEAGRLAYAVRDAFVADPVMAKVPVEHMLSAAMADELAWRIDRKAFTPQLGPIPQPKGSDTIYLTVADEKGMVVSFINSIFAGFGSGIVTRKTGVVLHNRGQGFVLDPKHPNCIAPGKRPMHTLVPALAMKGGDPWLSFGVMGGGFQPMGHVYVLTNMVDYGMDPQEAIDFPRMFFEGGKLEVEASVAESVYAELARRGHPVNRREDAWGGGQAIQIDRANGVLVGASDPRKDGCALGY